MRKPVQLAVLLTIAALLGGAISAQTGQKTSTGSKTGTSTPAPSAPSAKPQSTPADKNGSTTGAPKPDSPLKTQKDKLSYAIGMQVGGTISRQGIEVDPNVLLEGLKDAMAGKPIMTDEDVRATMMQLQSDMLAKQKQAGEANKKEGEAFLAANKGKEGVITLPSGLQYKVLKEGTGPKPAASDTVLCNYRGTLINGKEFDSSYKRGEPAKFPVNGVIKGWTEALQLMPVGSKWQLFIPAELAYGERGAGADIAPNSTLIFEVELLSIEGKEAGKK
jgi:FKBP-type peptidyl-prolyl cis-trans isomerase FklB